MAFLIACFALFLVHSTAVEVTYITVVDQSKLPGNPIRVLIIEEKHCLFECGLLARCASVNYHRAEQICSLNRNRAEDRNSLVEEQGWTYYEKYKVG